MSTSYAKKLTFAKDLALRAGEIMRKHFSLTTESEQKADITPVTIADLQINKLVIDSVKKTFPSHGIIGEEGSLHADTSEYVWICDPLDGTIPYSIGMPTTMFSLALYKNKRPILGVLYDPFLDRLYWAEEGKGSFLNTGPISVSKGILTPGDNIGACFYIPYKLDFEKTLRAIVHKKVFYTCINSLVYLAAYVANGKFKGAILPRAYVWDRAATKIIIKNAGGMMTDEKGNDLDVFSENTIAIVASNGDCHEELLAIVQAALK